MSCTENVRGIGRYSGSASRSTGGSTQGSHSDSCARPSDVKVSVITAIDCVSQRIRLFRRACSIAGLRRFRTTDSNDESEL